MKALFGGILLAVGILVAGVTGLCSLAVLVMGGQGGGDGLFLVLLIGGVPFLIGLGLIFAGRALLRSARQVQRDAGSADPGGSAEP
jgi:hypothetical protein